MLVVPGESEGQDHRTSSDNQGPYIPSSLQEMVSDVSSTTSITVADVSSTSSDIVIAPLNERKQEEDDDDDEPPVIIDVMINTSHNQYLIPTAASSASSLSMPQLSYQNQWGGQRGVQSLPLEELSNTSTISAAESGESLSKPKYSLNDLINALSQSLEQDQATTPQLSVMLSPAIQQFNLSQATALQADPGLSGIAATGTPKTKTPRGRARGRGRGSSTGRGRGRRRKNSDGSPEMPQLIPEVQNTDICYDNLPESSESGNDEGPPKISRIVNRRTPRSRTSTPAKSATASNTSTKSATASNASTMSSPPRDEPFIPSLLYRSLASEDTVEMNKEEDDNEEEVVSSDQAIHVTVKMYEVNGKTMYKCTECGKDFSKTCTFARHAMQHSKMYPYQCGICDMKCGDMRILLRHLDQHAEDADCPCQKCDRMNKDFTEETQRKVSAAFHFKCNLCGKKFFSDYACKMHVNAHKRKMTLTCEKCKLEFRCNRILSRHRKAVHDTQFCPVCLETCSNLVMHMRTHFGFTLYRCGLCGDGFNSRPHLHDHLRIHTQLGERQIPTVVSAINSSSKSDSVSSDSKQKRLKDQMEAKMATETLMALGGGAELPSVSIKTDEKKLESLPTAGDQSPTDFIVRTGEYEDEDGEIDVHVIPKTRRERFKSKSSEVSEDKDISVEVAVPPLPRRQVSRRCRWHGNDSLCERCDDSFVKKMSANRKRRSGDRGRRGSKSPRSDYSDNSLRWNSDSLDSLKNIEFSLPLANYILKGDDSKQDTFLKLEESKTKVQGEPTVIELSD